MTRQDTVGGGVADYTNCKPRKGDRGSCIMLNGESVGFTVSSIEGNLCFAHYDNGDTGPFIWKFTDGLNIFHSWPSKADALQSREATHG